MLCHGYTVVKRCFSEKLNLKITGNGDEDFDKALENFKKAEKFRELADAEEEKLLRTEKRLEEARQRLQAYKFQEEIQIEDCGVSFLKFLFTSTRYMVSVSP